MKRWRKKKNKRWRRKNDDGGERERKRERQRERVFFAFVLPLLSSATPPKKRSEITASLCGGPRGSPRKRESVT